MLTGLQLTELSCSLHAPHGLRVLTACLLAHKLTCSLHGHMAHGTLTGIQAHDSGYPIASQARSDPIKHVSDLFELASTNEPHRSTEPV